MKFVTIRSKIAGWLSPEWKRSLEERELNLLGIKLALDKRESEIDNRVGDRVAEIMLKMDPYEPLMRRLNIAFSKRYDQVEDNLDAPSQIRLFMWAYGQRNDPSFKHFTDWLVNRQGNLTVRESTTDEHWLFGRATLAFIALFLREVGRLALRFEEMSIRSPEFNKNAITEE